MRIPRIISGACGRPSHITLYRSWRHRGQLAFFSEEVPSFL
ncbi:unnamed protein product [Chondrus crispus]|uniref:Uncharacterized protein n=1 Tax=Chondrus crispus TaxID=2769 RepID=R7QDV1_CHOCR|nr:unnamed protein product [Chondrus crispus]CDF35621.1 unnamed protein product [Chondrus crispus]|eukprot:XP_005715440.1 unnamed protein product [Chondrus crispus]